MSFNDELQAKLAAVQHPDQVKTNNTVTPEILEERLVDELEDKLEFSQYDLDESDILRAMKIQNILNTYPNSFSHPSALQIFYIISQTDLIGIKNVHKLSQLSAQTFTNILNTMLKDKLIILDLHKRVELTMNGQSLSERIGVDVFI